MSKPRKHGRPTKFTQPIADEICQRLSTGEPLTWICRDEHMPATRTVSDWKQRHEAFSADFAHARNDGFDAIAAECLEIANTPLEGLETTSAPDGERITRKDMLGHRRLQIDTRLKLLAKWDPKRYGEMMRNEISGPDGGDIPLASLGEDAMRRIAEQSAQAQRELDSDG